MCVKQEWEKSVIENLELLKKSKQSEMNVFFQKSENGWVFVFKVKEYFWTVFINYFFMNKILIHISTNQKKISLIDREKDGEKRIYL